MTSSVREVPAQTCRCMLVCLPACLLQRRSLNFLTGSYLYRNHTSTLAQKSILWNTIGGKQGQSHLHFVCSLIFVFNHVKKWFRPLIIPIICHIKEKTWRCDTETDSSITWWCATNNYFLQLQNVQVNCHLTANLRTETNGWQVVFALKSWSALRSLNPFLQP